MNILAFAFFTALIGYFIYNGLSMYNEIQDRRLSSSEAILKSRIRNLEISLSAERTVTFKLRIESAKQIGLSNPVPPQIIKDLKIIAHEDLHRNPTRLKRVRRIHAWVRKNS